MSRAFNGGTTLDMITFGVGAAPPDQGPITIAVLAKATGVGTNTSYMIQGMNGSTAVWSFLFSNNAGGKMFIEGDFGAGGAGLTTDWAWYVITKAAGSALPRFSSKDVTTGGAWAHANGTFSVGDGTGPITSIRVGSNNALGTTFRGSIAVIGLWDTQLSDADVELACTLAYSDIVTTKAAKWAVKLNQASIATSVTNDAAGGGNQTAISNTAVDVTGTPDPPGYNYTLSSTTPFTHDYSLQWRVLNSFTKDTSLQWRVLNAFTADTSLQWRVLNAFTKDTSLQWRVLNGFTHDYQLQWNVLNSFTKDVSLQWRVLNSFTHDTSLQWRVLNGFTADTSLQWRVLNAFHNDYDIQWAILSGTAFTHDYSLQWRVLNAFQADTSLQWRVLNAFQNDYTLQWQVLSGSAFQHDYVLQWRVLNGFVKDTNLQWRVLNHFTKDTNLQWRVLGPSSIVFSYWYKGVEVPADIEGIWNGSTVVPVTSFEISS